MKNPIPAARRSMRWAAWGLRRIQDSLRRREGSLSFYAERGGPLAAEAEVLAGDLGCLLADQLGPALDALERAARPAAGVDP